MKGQAAKSGREKAKRETARTHRRFWPTVLIVFSGLAVLAAGLLLLQSDTGVSTTKARVLNRYPHDPQAFTQGLVYSNGFLYESTGQYGESTLRRVALETGEVVAEVRLEPELFGEGLALQGNRLIQLTWKAGRGLVYDGETLEKVDEFEYEGEGWGLVTDGKRLLMSSGSSRLQVVDPETWEVTGEVRVR
ncbi:glutaminyl-peptide cyclotransferase, partial [bacterium]|nr:glutaminyl-peptide cyclotransferase [bacterium]